MPAAISASAASARQLEAARTDDELRDVVASLWALAVTIEDGDVAGDAKALRAAQDALKQAWSAAPATRRSRS